MNPGGMLAEREIKRAARTGLLPVCAGVFGCYHILLSVGTKYWAQMPRVFLYLGYLLTLVFVAAVGRECLQRLRDRKGKSALLEIPGGILLWGLVVFFVWLCMCSLLTERVRPGSFRENIGCLYDAAVSFFVLFPLGAFFAGRGETRPLRRLFFVLVLIFALLSAYGLYAAFTNQTLPLGGGAVLMSKHQMEFPGNRLVLAANPNTTGLHCAVLLMAVLFLLTETKRAVRCIAVVAGLVIYFALALADSRASILATGLGFGITAGLLVWRRSRTHPLWLRLAAALAGGAAALILFVKGRDLVYAIYESVVAVPLPGGQGGARDIMVTPEGDSTLGYRLQLIQVSIRALRDDPELLSHGCAPYNVAVVLGEYGYPLYTHNQFMEIGVAYGVPAMVLYTLWLAALAVRCLRVGLAGQEKLSLAPRILAVLLLVMVINNLAEATLLFYRYLSGSIFFLAAGYIAGLPVTPRRRKSS